MLLEKCLFVDFRKIMTINLVTSRTLSVIKKFTFTIHKINSLKFFLKWNIYNLNRFQELLKITIRNHKAACSFSNSLFSDNVLDSFNRECLCIFC